MNPPSSGHLNDPASPWVSASTAPGGFRTKISTRTHAYVADEPVAAGGTDEGPTPYEYLLGALSACTAMTVRMYADRKQWPLTSLRVDTRRVLRGDKEVFERVLTFAGDLTDQQRARFLEIAEKTPVTLTLKRGVEITTTVAAGAADVVAG